MRFALSLVAVLALAPAAFAQEVFPRRLLFVHVADYLYLNPLTHAAPGGADRVRDAANRLAAGLRVPTGRDNDQLFILSDTVADSPLPTRDVLSKAIGSFCDTTRAQDRVVLYFGVHALEKDGKAFVAPVDGDPAEPASLVPVADVYARLKDLKAAQKVVIWDVCRHNPERVRGRRDPGPMTPALLKALTTVPEGVQVLVSCSPGEHALEYFVPRGPAGLYAGSAYLDALRKAATDLADTTKPKPGATIPVGAISVDTAKVVTSLAKSTGHAQSPVLLGLAPKFHADYDPKEPPAKRFEFAAPPKGAPVEGVKAILAELALPPLLDADSGTTVARMPFSEAALKERATDVPTDDILREGEKYPLRVATLRALQTMRNEWPLGKQRMADTLTPPITDPRKKTIADAQVPVAAAMARLELELAGLEAVAGKRAKETKRWQANYDFALAELRLRLVLLNEYNRALGNVRTETLPDLKGGTGWRLVAAATVEGKKEVRDLFAAAESGFERIAAEHKGTPWEVLAKRSRAALPSAKWEPFHAPKPEK
jgi:hypothetical protein